MVETNLLLQVLPQEKYQNWNPGHYVKVSSFNIDDNAVQCSGPLKASSESLTHAAIYLGRFRTPMQ